MSAGTVPRQRIRATDAERRHTVERLCRAHAEGCLTLEEFDGRVAVAWAAKTRADLAEMAEDLPAFRAVADVPLCQTRRTPIRYCGT